MRWIIVCALLAACGDNNEKSYKDAGIDAPPDAPGSTSGCLGPGVPMAPNGQLPCDLIPPGLSL